MSRRRGAAIAAVVLAAVAAWFTAVDAVAIERDCLDCQSSVTVRNVRVATVPLTGAVQERPSLLAMVADDLGTPCPHARARRWTSDRRLGLLLPVVDEPVLHAVRRPWYPLCAREAARSLATSEPGLAAEFRSRVLDGHDWDYWTGLRDRLFAPCPPDQRPEALAESVSPAALSTPESGTEAGADDRAGPRDAIDPEPVPPADLP